MEREKKSRVFSDTKLTEEEKEYLRKKLDSMFENPNRGGGKVPRKKMMTGHTKDYDVYVTPRGKTYTYSGTKAEDWKKSKYWEKQGGKVSHRKPMKKFDAVRGMGFDENAIRRLG